MTVNKCSANCLSVGDEVKVKREKRMRERDLNGENINRKLNLKVWGTGIESGAT